MREPTPQEIAKFKRACKALDELAREGFDIYLGESTMYLMVGPSHDEKARAQQHNIRAAAHIRGSGGGDW